MIPDVSSALNFNCLRATELVNCLAVGSTGVPTFTAHRSVLLYQCMSPLDSLELVATLPHEDGESCRDFIARWIARHCKGVSASKCAHLTGCRQSRVRHRNRNRNPEPPFPRALAASAANSLVGCGRLEHDPVENQHEHMTKNIPVLMTPQAKHILLLFPWS